MKKILIILITVIGVTLAILLLAFGNRRTIEAEVVKVENNTVTFKDVTNNLWEYETDVYYLNDKVILTLNDKGTEFITDDEIIKIKKVGE